MRWAERLTHALGEPSSETISWAQIKGSGTTALFGSENVSSLTDNAGGDYTVTWTIPYATASSYAVVLGTSGTTNATTLHFRGLQAITATSARTSLLDYNAASATDPDYAYLIALGEF